MFHKECQGKVKIILWTFKENIKRYTFRLCSFCDVIVKVISLCCSDPPFISKARGTGTPVGQRGVLQCEASAVPRADFEWYKEDRRQVSYLNPVISTGMELFEVRDKDTQKPTFLLEGVDFVYSKEDILHPLWGTVKSLHTSSLYCFFIFFLLYKITGLKHTLFHGTAAE